jgi:hypothetical protein
MTLVEDLKRAKRSIELANVDPPFVLFDDGTVMPILRLFDHRGHVTKDPRRAVTAEFGGPEFGYGELGINGIIKKVEH